MKSEPSRVRENGTKNFSTKTDSDKVTACRVILHDKAYAKVNGWMVDHFTASAIVAVYERLNPVNQAKFISASIEKMAIVAYRLLERNRA